MVAAKMGLMLIDPFGDGGAFDIGVLTGGTLEEGAFVCAATGVLDDVKVAHDPKSCIGLA